MSKDLLYVNASAGAGAIRPTATSSASASTRMRDISLPRTNSQRRRRQYHTGAGRASSQELHEFGPAPLGAQDVLVEEGQHRLVPDPGVARGEHPVVLVREVQEA